jgi:pimeloyl-ACP methyl ester carboxylesterase
VTAPTFPLTSLADDVEKLAYGGQVITALGTDAPNVVGLVYIATFGLDEGESLGGLLSQGLPTQALEHQFVDDQGFVWLTEGAFVNHFESGVDPVKAKVMYATQQPLAGSAFSDEMGVPAWKSLPSWYLVAQDDQALPADAERMFAERMGATTIEIPAGHLAMVSHPAEVANLIDTAARSVPVAA